VKYFQRTAPNIVHLKPANQDFKDIEINLEETELFIEGKSVGLIREN
jgi:SOS-response transcriptional repressor LexA